MCKKKKKKKKKNLIVLRSVFEVKTPARVWKNFTLMNTMQFLLFFRK